DGQCIGCTPNCENRQCGDDGCGQTCGSCPSGKTCSVGECSPYPAWAHHDMLSMYYINEFRTKNVKYASDGSLINHPDQECASYGIPAVQCNEDGFPRKPWCVQAAELKDGASGFAISKVPARLNADMVANARRTMAHKLGAWETQSADLCNHDDPIDTTG